MLEHRRWGTRQLWEGLRGRGALTAAGLALLAVLSTLLASSAGAAGTHTPATDCQPFSGTPCLLPFPNDLFTRQDRSTPTGLRLRLPAGAMPVNVKGQRIGVAQPQATNLMIIPAKALDEGHTYVVALRRLRNASGRVLKAPAWFARLRDGRRLLRGERSQRSRYARIFAALSRAGIGRRSLHEAWDFTVGSQKSLTSRLLSIRNRAFAQLGDRNLADGKVRSRAPSYRITSITSLTPQLRHIQGTLQVPCYLVTCGSTATTAFHYRSGKADALPTQIPGDVATELRHAQLQISRCLQPNGSVVNVCGGKPCHSYNCTP